MTARWNNQQLDEARYRADPLADDAVALFMRHLEEDDPSRLFHRLVSELRVEIEDADPAIQAYLAKVREVPAWADQQQITRAQRFFADFLTHHFAMLFLASLPSAYASAKGAHPLILTAQLTQQVRRRLNETSQFVMDVNTTGAFEEDGIAIDRIAHIRLMHAAVRWLIANDPKHYTRDVGDPRVAHTPPIWARTWGVPINQEDLAGTFLTFTTVVFNGFDRCGVVSAAEDREAYFHLWRVIATMLGIDAEYIPDTIESAEKLQALIWERQHRHNAAGVELERALLHAANEHSGRWLSWLFPTMSRVVLDPGVADMVDVPASTLASRLAVGLLEKATTVWSLLKREDRPLANFLGHIGSNLMEGSLAEDRHGRSVPFSVPTSLVADSHS